MYYILVTRSNPSFYYTIVKISVQRIYRNLKLCVTFISSDLHPPASLLEFLILTYEISEINHVQGSFVQCVFVLRLLTGVDVRYFEGIRIRHCSKMDRNTFCTFDLRGFESSTTIQNINTVITIYILYFKYTKLVEFLYCLV